MAYVTHKITVIPSGKVVEVDHENQKILENYTKAYPYGFYIGDESRQWVEENMSDYIFIDGRMHSKRGNFEQAVCFRNKADAARFKLTFK